MNILLVEDDLQLGKALCRALELTGFNLCWVRLLSDAENKLSPGGFDMMLLDLTLPDGDGLQKLIARRAAGQNIPIIILTARDRIESLVNSLDSGADDFLAKPFALPELISRVKAVNRRMAGFASQTWSLGTLYLDPVNHQVTLDNELLMLSKRVSPAARADALCRHRGAQSGLGTAAVRPRRQRGKQLAGSAHA